MCQRLAKPAISPTHTIWYGGGRVLLPDNACRGKSPLSSN
jgi:hypothetical protein